MKIFTCSLLFISFSVFALTPAQKTHWENLLHYDDGIFSKSSSVQNKEFFLHPEGDEDSLVELQTFLNEVKKPAKSFKKDMHPACRFPARYLFAFNNRLTKVQFNFNNCPDYKYFRKKISIAGVKLVFASYFINNPSSAFGHTLFKIIGNQRRTGGNQLLDYGANYAASVDTNNPFLYGVKGITGGFVGNYSLLPYFYKLIEYKDTESRDMWEYELNLTPFQLEMFAAHLWEMNKAVYHYYYFTRNCSYQLMAFLDAVNPEWKLVKKLPYFVAPIQTVFAISKVPGLVKKKELVPSKEKIASRRISFLESKSKEILKKSLDKLKLEKGYKLDRKEESELLDAAIDTIDFLYPDEVFLKKGPKAKKVLAFKAEVLSQRSQVRERANKLVFDNKNSPDLGHKIRKISLMPGIQDNVPFGLLNYRFAIHSLNDPAAAYPRSFTLEMGETSIEIPESDKPFFNFFKLVKIQNIRPWNFLNKLHSWTLEAGLKDQKLTSDQEVAPFVKTSGGMSLGTMDYKVMVASFLEYNLDGRFERRDHFLNIGPKVLFHFNFGEHIRFLSEAYYHFNTTNGFNSYFELNNHFTFNFNWFSFGIQQERIDRVDRYSTSLNYFF